jgi:Tfp pilus assembly PilM family ATPase
MAKPRSRKSTVSLSWTKPFSVAPSARAGIAIGRGQVCAAVLDTERGNHQLRAVRVRKLPEQLFSGQPGGAAEASLAEALRSVSEEFRNEFASVRVALPDTVIRSTVFDLDELPKTGELRTELLRWRFAREWQRPEESLDCRGFDLGEDGGKRVFFGQAADRPWLDCVRRALASAGIAPWSLNAAAVYRFNCFHEAIAGASGALLSLDAECWNLLFWDKAGRVRRVLTRMREAGNAEAEAASIADEAERAIFAYVNSDGARTVGKLYLAGNEAEMARLSSVFAGRVRDGAVLLHADERVSGVVSGMREGLAPLALAAALET